MIRTWKMDGQLYSTWKKEIKASWRGLKWVGDRDHCKWESKEPRISIVANFGRRDGVTVSAEIIYTGPKDNKILQNITRVLSELGIKDYQDEIDQKVEDEELERRIQMELEVRMGTWDMTNKPNIEYMKRPSAVGIHKGAPPQMIEAALRDYQEKRNKRVAELRAEIEAELGVENNRTKEEEDEQFIQDVLSH